MIDITCYIRHTLRCELIYIILLQVEVFGCASDGIERKVCVFDIGEILLGAN